MKFVVEGQQLSPPNVFLLLSLPDLLFLSLNTCINQNFKISVVYIAALPKKRREEMQLMKENKTKPMHNKKREGNIYEAQKDSS